MALAGFCHDAVILHLTVMPWRCNDSSYCHVMTEPDIFTAVSWRGSDEITLSFVGQCDFCNGRLSVTPTVAQPDDRWPGVVSALATGQPFRSRWRSVWGESPVIRLHSPTERALPWNVIPRRRRDRLGCWQLARARSLTVGAGSRSIPARSRTRSKSGSWKKAIASAKSAGPHDQDRLPPGREQPATGAALDSRSQRYRSQCSQRHRL